jgi:uncharacterized protein
MRTVPNSVRDPSVVWQGLAAVGTGGLAMRSGQSLRTTAWYAGGVFGEILWTHESGFTSPDTVSPPTKWRRRSTAPRLVEPGRDGTRLVYCGTTAGRHLLVVVAEAPDGRDFIVTARDMTEMEKRAFRRRGR